MSASKLFTGVFTLAVAINLVSGEIYSVNWFPDDTCNTLGYYNTFMTPDDEYTCGSVSIATKAYTQVNGQYEGWWTVPPMDPGCGITITRDSSDGSRPCGSCVGLLSGDSACSYIAVPEHFYVGQCCGDVCQQLCASIPGKRSTNETLEIGAPKADPRAVKARSPFENKKRDDCRFVPSGGLFTKVGNPVRASDTFQSCPSNEGCSVGYMASISTSFSQTFGVSSSTEAGLFDIVSETVTFSYDAEWSTEHTNTVTGTYTVPEGVSGYLTFSPLSQCNAGHFEGADCGAKGLPTDGLQGDACVPEVSNGGSQAGDINVVTTG